jgi:hypothetical protein
MRISTRRIPAVALMLCAVALAACGLAKPMPPLNSFGHQNSDGTAALYWDCSRPGAGVVRIEGWANNPYYPNALQDLEVILYGVNAQGSTVSQAKASAQNYQIQTNEPSPFSVDLRTVGGEVRYDMVYQYWGGGDSGMGRRGGMGGGGERHQNMARDVCVGLAP